MTEISLKINGIDCAACVRRLSRALSAQSGVISARVSYAEGRAEIGYDAAVTDIAAIARCIRNAGYAVPADTLTVKCEDVSAAAETIGSLGCAERIECDAQRGTVTALLWPLGIDENYISRALGRGDGIELKRSDAESTGRAAQAGLARGIFAALFFSLPQLWDIPHTARIVFGALTLFGGVYFFGASLRAIRKKVFSPDIAAALLLTALYALCAAGKANFLLLTAATVLLLAVRLAESRAVYALGAAARRLSHMQPKTARILRGGEEAEISSDELREGDILIVLPGERIAADGEIVSGDGMVDESAVTGAEELSEKRRGDTVLCGTLLRTGKVRVSVVRAGKDTVLQSKISGLGTAALPHALSSIASALGMTAVFTLLLRGEVGEK